MGRHAQGPVEDDEVPAPSATESSTESRAATPGAGELFGWGLFASLLTAVLVITVLHRAVTGALLGGLGVAASALLAALARRRQFLMKPDA